MNVNKEWKNKSGIYKISFRDTIYIGSSVDLYHRLSQHISTLRKNKHHSKMMQNYFNKYGESQFKIDILEYCERNILLLREKEEYYIKSNVCKFNSTLPVSYQHSFEMKQKIAATMKKMWAKNPELNPRLGKGHRIWVYDLYGNLLKENLTSKEVVTLLNLSNRSVVNNSIRYKRPIVKKQFIILKDNDWNTLYEHIIKKQGIEIPMYKLFKNGSIEKCTTMSRVRMARKTANSKNLTFFSKKNNCFYTFIGLIEKCRLREEIPQIITAELSKEGENPNLN